MMELGPKGDTAVTESGDARLTSLFDVAIRSLRTGFFIAAILMICGLVWSLIKDQALDHDVIAISELPGALLDGDPGALVDLAILAIMFTPVATVALVGRGFFQLGERRFAIVSFVVLSILAISIAISLLR